MYHKQTDPGTIDVVSFAQSFRVRERLCPRLPSDTFLSAASRRSAPKNQEEYSSPMGENGRGDVYAELERACDELDRTLEQLKKAGYTFREFAKVLETDPTGVLMTHYPSGYMIYPDEINKTPWEYTALRPIVDLDYIIELLKRARQLKRAKMEMERRLGKRIVPLA